MGIFDGVLLASDYDGTLRGDRMEVLERDLAAIRYFQAEGGTFLVATGRCYADFWQQARQLPLTQPVLLSNGATFCRMETGEEIFCHGLPDQAREDVAAALELAPEVGLVAYHGERSFCWRPNEYTDYHSRLVQSPHAPMELEEMPYPWLKALFLGPHAALEAVQGDILRRCGGRYECIFSADILLELTAKGVHKGAGVLEAAALLGIDRAHICCVGDNDNDLTMLRAAALAFAPAGSIAAGRNVPGVRVVRDADHGCVEHVVELLRRHYSG